MFLFFCYILFTYIFNYKRSAIFPIFPIFALQDFVLADTRCCVAITKIISLKQKTCFWSEGETKVKIRSHAIQMHHYNYCKYWTVTFSVHNFHNSSIWGEFTFWNLSLKSFLVSLLKKIPMNVLEYKRYFVCHNISFTSTFSCKAKNIAYENLVKIQYILLTYIFSLQYWQTDK